MNRHLERRGYLLDRAQGQIALASFQSADVGPVVSEDLGEGFLGQALLIPVPAKVAADDTLEITYGHPLNGSVVLPEDLQTYK